MNRRTAPTGRTIHLIDIENLCGHPRPAMAAVQRSRVDYLKATRAAAGDHFVVATNHGAGLNVGLGWPGARLLLRSGPHGADDALLGVIGGESISQRFARVAIGSGDGIFAGAAALLASCGTYVTVVARAGSLSKRLKLAAATHILLPAVPATEEAA